MYARHFALREPPFSITPDTSFFFAHAAHQEALNTLLVAVRSGEGFIKVTGEVGTGKTLLCRKFLSALATDRGFVSAYIPNPYLQPTTLLMAIADELRIEHEENLSQHQLLKQLTKFLLDSYGANRRVIVCLDEAQAMPVETLEALRLLSNLETEKRKLLQVVLFGQPELDVRLEDPAIRQLKQRIGFSCKLSPLSPAEVEYYIAHRLSIAGYRGGRLFSVGALKTLYRASRGIPRLVNILAHKSLMAAFGEGRHAIEHRHVKLAVVDTESVNAAGAARPFLKYVAAAAATLLVSAAALFWAHAL